MDVKLRASLMMGHELPMPKAAAWAKWTKDLDGKLAGKAPLVLDDDTSPDVRTGVIRAWQGEPEPSVICTATGKLKLSGVELGAWQAILLPRQWSSSDTEPDDDPGEQLEELFGRVKVALEAWSEGLDGLT